MADKALERFYDGLGNVVLRDTNGNPSIFVRHPKVNSSYFDATYLPDTPHPAFCCGEDEDDAVLIGKYVNTSLATGGPFYSLPGVNGHDIAAPVATQQRIAAFGHNATMMTIADRGLLLLMAHKFGDDAMRGANGNQLDLRDVDKRWSYSENVAASDVGKIYGFRGWAWKALAAHTTSAATRPDVAPQYWERLGKIGGTYSHIDIGYSSVPQSDEFYNPALNGSGPASYFMLCDPTLESDIIGIGGILIPDFRIYHGEIQIIPYNLAALPDTDIGENSSEWKAILPHENDAGCDFVSPGTSGTLKYVWKNSKITIVGRAAAEGELDSGYRTTNFKDIAVESDSVPVMPSIMYELGLAPIPGTTVHGRCHALRLTTTNVCHPKAFGIYTENNIATYEETNSINDTGYSRSRVRVLAEA